MLGRICNGCKYLGRAVLFLKGSRRTDGNTLAAGYTGGLAKPIPKAEPISVAKPRLLAPMTQSPVPRCRLPRSGGREYICCCHGSYGRQRYRSQRVWSRRHNSPHPLRQALVPAPEARSVRCVRESRQERLWLDNKSWMVFFLESMTFGVLVNTSIPSSAGYTQEVTSFPFFNSTIHTRQDADFV